MEAHDTRYTLRKHARRPGKLSAFFVFLLIALSCSSLAVAQAQHRRAPRSAQAEDVIDAASAPISVSVSPGIASVATGGNLALTASVQNDTSGEGVTWSYTNPTCTTSTNTDYIVVTTSTACGTLTNATTSSVTYNAPSTVPSPAAITVTATSVADTTKSSSATLMVTNGSLNVWVSPTGATVQVSHSRTFTAIVSGNSNTQVTWEVNGVAGGASATGTISSAGLYTAPSSVPSGGTVTVTAVSQANSAVYASVVVAVSLQPLLPLPIHGVTIEDYNFVGTQTDIRTSSYLSEVEGSLDTLTDTPSARIVFTVEVVASGGVGSNGTEGATASSYSSALESMKGVSRPPYLLGEVLDSSYTGCFSLTDHDARWNQYISTLGSYVDFWEVGNEINGNWLDSADASQSCLWTVPSTTDKTVVQKMNDAYNIVRANGRVAELTLYYPGQESVCGNGSPDPFEPITWVKANVPANMLNGMDYVLISYYHSDCTAGKDPTAETWGHFFTAVQNMFPNAQIGFGEWGYSCDKSSCSYPSKTKRTNLINQGYSLDPTSMPFSDNWVSGVFYWEFNDDAVPDTATFWSLINTDMQSQP